MTTIANLTNRQLLADYGGAERGMRRRTLLTAVDQQRTFLIERDNVRQPCPNCGRRQNFFEAAGVDIDDVDYLQTRPTDLRCRGGCERALTYDVPFVAVGGPGWNWGLVPLVVAAAGNSVA